MPELQPGDHVMVNGSYEGGRTISFTGTVVAVKISGTVIVDDDNATDGLGTPTRHYVSRGTITNMPPPLPWGETVVEEGEYVVKITLSTVITFSPIERDSPLCDGDAIANAYGTLPDDFIDNAVAEGWAVSAEAERLGSS